MEPSGRQTDVEAAVLAAIDEDATIQLLRDLISAPSENPPGNEAAVVELLARALLEAGLRPVIEEVAPLRPNLEAIYGRPGGPVLLLTGHSDTMPAGSGWSSPPQTPVVRDGRVYGRGACDMKAGLAAMLEAIKAVRRAKAPLRGQVVFEAVVDEEKGSIGARAAVRHGRRADWAIISEPTDLQVLRVGNGQVNFDVEFIGTAAHGSTPERGQNAIYDAALFVTEVEHEAARITGLRHPLVGPATYSVGTITGGVQTSIVPDRCFITVDRRILPGQTAEDAAQDMAMIVGRVRRQRPSARVQWQIEHATPSIDVPEDVAVCRVLRQALADVRGVDQGYGGMRATSNAAIYIDAGIPTIICGPGSISESAHRPDEFVPIRELHEATRAFALTIVRLLSDGREGWGTEA